MLSIQDDFDTSTASGKMVFSVIGAMAEYERNLIRERMMEGMKTADGRHENSSCVWPDGWSSKSARRESGEGGDHIDCSRSTYCQQVASNLKDGPERSA